MHPTTAMGAAAEPDPSSEPPHSPSSAPPPPLPLDLCDLRAIAILGRGAKGVVFLVRPAEHSPTDGGDQHHHHRHLALKAISRRLLHSGTDGKERPSPPHPDGVPRSGGADRRIRFEREVLAALDHPLLPALRGVVSTDEIVGFAMDRCSGGTLDALRKRQTENMFSEEAIRFYAAELVLALEHLHGLGIVYRDLKPDNVLIQGNGHIMLVDFDLSTRLPVITPAPADPTTSSSTPSSPYPHHSHSRPHRKQRRTFLRSCLSCGPHASSSSALDDLSPSTSSSTASSSSTSGASASSSVGKSNSFVGTEEYVAPEVIRGTGHDFAVDWWGLGIVLYEMLYGRTPFRGQNRKETFYRVLSKDPDLAGESNALRDLIGRLLEKDPEKRIKVGGIRGHEFFSGVDWVSVTRIARPPFIPVEEVEDEFEEEEGIDVEGFVRRLFFPEGGNGSRSGSGHEGGDSSNDEGKKAGGHEEEAGDGDRRPKDASGMENGTKMVVADSHNTWVHVLPKPSQDDHFSAF